jgi:ribosomal protein L24
MTEGKPEKYLKVFPKDLKVIIEGINIKKKTYKTNSEESSGWYY